MAIFLFLVIGYLLGSLSPGYFFGRAVKGIDIRKFGQNKNTGASNTYREIGPIYGIITGIFDALKAAAAYWIAVTGLTSIICWSDQYKPCLVDPNTAILVGVAAVAGHIWPFYLGFRGGHGTASLVGLCITVLFFTQSIFALILVISALIFRIMNSGVIIFEAPARKLLKLGGLFFSLGIIWLSSKLILKIALYLLVVSFCFDLARFYLPKINTAYLKLKKLSKEKELKRLSGYTLFLFSIFLISRFFHPQVAVVSLSFFIVGDIFAPLGKKVFLPFKLIGGKTIGGFILISTFATVTGIFINSLTPVALSRELIVSGALITAVLDQFSFILDDNILVPIGTAIILAIVF